MRCASPPESVAERRSSVSEVVEADVVQKLQPLPDLDQDFVGDGALFLRQLQYLEEFVRLRDIEPHEIGQGLAGDPDVHSRRSQPRPFAIRALRVTAISAHENANVNFVFLSLDLFEKEAHVVVDELFLFFGEIAEGDFQADLSLLGGLHEFLVVVPAILRLGPGVDSPVGK